MNELVLVGGDEDAPTEFDVGTAFAFGDPFGVLLKDGVEFFSGGDFASFEETIVNEEDVLDEEVVKVGDHSYFEDLCRGEWMKEDFDEGAVEFFFKLVELGEVVGRGADDSVLFVGSTTFAGLGGVAHAFFNLFFPVSAFSPTGDAKVGGESAGEFNAFAGGVPGEV
jgi:hypothetical protein